MTVSENGAIEASYTYDTNGNRASLTLGNGVVTIYSYNLANWVISVFNTKNNGGVISNYSYEYYVSGNQKSKTDNTGAVTTYSYDDLGRLTRESESDGTILSYTYDAAGNRSRLTATGIESYVVDYSYNAANQLTSEVKAIGEETETTTYTYDANGNTLTVTSPESLQVNTYNLFNQLTATNINGNVSAYVYNTAGIRTAKSVNGVCTVFLLDGGNVVGEIQNDTVIATYLRGANLLSTSTDDGTNYYLFNAHGDVVNLVDSNCNITKSYDYDAFGNEKEPSENDYNPFRYCGEYFDKETGTYYLRARYYDLAIGRFTAIDPVKDGFNWYAYCSNNPIAFIDPLGLFDYNTVLSYSNVYNEDVEILQNELVKLGYLNMSDESWGYFGSQTVAAVNAYKNDLGIENTGNSNGIVDLAVWTSLGLIYRTQADIDAGISIITINRKQYKDITVPLNKALSKTVKIAEVIDYILSRYENEQFICTTFLKGVWFISQVYHRAPWDIKRELPWNETIANGTFPGVNSQVYYNGWLATPEELGNYTYAYIGRALGFSLPVLYAGSWVAAGLPTKGSNLENEYNDWPAITYGYFCY